jgi:hypothetical protein
VKQEPLRSFEIPEGVMEIPLPEFPEMDFRILEIGLTMNADTPADDSLELREKFSMYLFIDNHLYASTTLLQCPLTGQRGNRLAWGLGIERAAGQRISLKLVAEEAARFYERPRFSMDVALAAPRRGRLERIESQPAKLAPAGIDLRHTV